MRARITLFVLVLFLFTRCERQEATIPSYIRIPAIELVTDENTEGTQNNRITDAWVFVDDQPVGAYELPAKFPVLKEGIHNVEVRAGIKLNGIASTRYNYTFYSGYTVNADLKPNAVVELQPVVKYADYADFALLENFENIGMAFSETANSHVKPVLVTDPSLVFEGKKSLKGTLGGNDLLFEVATTNDYVLPGEGAEVFLEFNYKITQEMRVGIFANTSGGVVQDLTLILRPTVNNDGVAYWNKIYISLTGTIGKHPTANTFKIFFGSQISGVDDQTSGEYYLDNIKLIH